MTLKLSTTVINGLKFLDLENTSLDLSKKLIANSLKLTLHPGATITPVPELYASHADRAKQSEYAVVALFALATKHCSDPLVVRQSLEELSLNTSVIDELVRVYEDNRKELILRQLQVAHNFPHITDVEWRIVCDVKSSTSASSTGEVGFVVNLGRFNQRSGDRETIAEFLCNTEELQLLINKLKEIERHCEKIASE